MRENKDHPLPLQIFECSDVAMKDMSTERRSRNQRRVSAIWCNKAAEFEVIHGLLDRLMESLNVRFIKESDKANCGYYLKETQGL